MNLSPTPKTPIRTPQPGSSAKSLQLTPIWEEVIKNGRLPLEINQDQIFQEISIRLEDLEWPVRQHAFRVLSDIIPILPKDCLDERMIQNDILNKLVINLGHPAPGIRKVASETVQKYLRRTGQTEKMLEALIQYGVKEVNLINNDKARILGDNITLGTIVSLPDILRPFVLPENGGYCLTQALLVKIIQTLSTQVRNPNYREECLESFRKIRDLVGQERFRKGLEITPDKDFILSLMFFGGERGSPGPIEEIMWSDETKSDNSYDDINYLHKPDGYKENAYIVSNESSEDCTDGTDTETYTKDPTPNDIDADPDFCTSQRPDVEYLSPSTLSIDGDKRKETPEKGFSAPPSPRILLEAEIQLAKNKAVTMRVTQEDEEEMEEEDDSSSNANSESSLVERRFTTEDGNLIMKLLHSNEEIESADKPRTPRRVHFGGEVIKLRTPDSDTTDITIEICEAERGQKERKEEGALMVKDVSKEVEIESLLEVEPEEKVLPSSQIPVPVAPVTSSPRDFVTSRRRDVVPTEKKSEEEQSNPSTRESSSTSKADSLDSAPSSSGSETDVKDLWEENEEVNFWQWVELRLIEENLLNYLRNKDNWKIQYEALEDLKLVLISPKTIERIAKLKNQNLLGSLFRCLLYKFSESSSQQVTTLSLSIVSQMIETLPRGVILKHVEDIVHGLCRYVGGCRNLNLKIESVQSLKTLFEILEPSSVMDVLLGDRCILSSSSKLRENALLAIMYATMVFPSSYFDTDKILEKVADSAIDARRRVRHAALEAIAILSQLPSTKTLTENIARVAGKLATPPTRAQLISAIQARLSRRLLPSISNEGLVLYALQIPASRRFGHMGNPMGADVDWILSGTGSLSTGSAKSKTQLNAAQRLDVKPTAPLSPKKWLSTGHKTSDTDDGIFQKMNGKIPSPENPWTIQKNRNDASTLKLNAEHTKCHPPKGKIGAKVEAKNDSHKNGGWQKNNIRPEDITWALVPLAALDDPQLGREKGTSLWADSIIDNLPHGFGPIRPVYLKLQPTQEQLMLSRSSEDVRRLPTEGKKPLNRFPQEGCTEIRLLTPTVLREKNSDLSFQNGKQARSENPTKIPVLFKNQRNLQKGQRFSAYVGGR
ncbi:hypothetical protein RUM43_011567 [Polyplax serrata]|uniref:TOG domain-containing protein n=1 Tax=Polyplax serrata TaxID=468196 RepID=A0AAN8P877_POLSC